jgi:hypothetical protein
MEKQQMGAGPLSGTSAFEEGSEASLAEAQRRLDHFINPTPAPTPAPSFGAVTLSYYSGLLLPQKNMTYYCRPFHYQGAKTSTDWQRIDGGITANSSYFANIIKKAEVEILDYDARYDELGMISNDYERQIFGFKGTDESGNVNPGKLEIRKLDSSQTPTDHEWTIMLRQVAYRMKTLAVESRVNLCKDFVGKYTRTFKYVITDTNDVESPPYYKTMNVQSAVIMYTDVSVEVTNAEDLLYLGRPRNFQSDLASEFSVDAQMERSGEEPVKESKFRRLSTSV